MAATQAENQQNEVNREQVQKDQPPDICNSVLQNGTDKGSGRVLIGSDSIVNSKTKSSGQNSLAVEMSQYRQESGAGPPILNNSGNGEQSANNTLVDSGKLNSDGKSFTSGSEQSAGADPNYNKGPDNSSPNMQGFGLGFSGRGNYHPDQHGANNPVQNSADNNLHQNNPFSQFGPHSMRHGYPGTKPIAGNPMMQPRPANSGPSLNAPSGGFSPQQQRFPSGQSISQPTGPTPTLNQLLQQSSNPVHRYPNNYVDYGIPKSGEQGPANMPYNQSWQAQRPMGYPPQQVAPTYRNQPPGGVARASQPYPGAAATGFAPQQGQPPPQQFPPYAQRFPTPRPTTFPGYGQGSPSPGAPPPQQQQQQQQPGAAPGSQPQAFPEQQRWGQQPPPPQASPQPSPHPPPSSPSQDLTGQNSNDSSSGPAPGTPNSQGMRPTPSPTGSTGSRSMSPAVGQQNIPMPPRPSSGQSDSSGPTRMSHSPMTTQGGYQQPLAPPHLHGYKIGSGQQIGPYTPQGQQYPQGNYTQRPQGNMQYGPGQTYGQQAPQSNNQYPNRPMPNHVSHPQFPGYQGWGGPGMNQGPPPSMIGGPGAAKTPGPQQSTGPPQPPNSTPGPRSHTPPHYLKTHLQHKMGFTPSSSGMPPSPGSLQVGYGGGSGPPPGMHHHGGMGSPMGPPSGPHHPGIAPPPPSMGPPGMMPPASSSIPTSAPSPLPNSHPPPPAATSTSNSHTDMAEDSNLPTTSVAGNSSTTVTTASAGTVTSVVTTGPDGAPLDEGSQQSTLSNASAASGEDPSCTPKSRKDGSVVGGGYHSHPPTPQSTVPSPGAASLNSMHEEYGDVNSPSWPRTPASPPDSLCKLYEMDENHERRMWLDKLLQFMEERGTPISACPTISKNPLDLFRLYLYVKERGGFMEVTKNKTWKDIAGLLGIGASSSAAYTLRKHYTKNLLAYECHFDRGGIDPQPIINQVEASSKKKGAKSSSVPSPGSSNSQDSFPAAGSSGATSMDGYSGYGYPPGSTPDYNSPPSMQRPASQSNAPSSPHPGVGVPTQGAGDNISVSNPFDDGAAGQRPIPYGPGGPPRPQGMQQGYQPGQSGYSQYPQDQYRPPGQEFNPQYPQPGSQYPPNRPMYPPYGSEGDRNYNQPSSNQPPASGQDPYNHGRYMGPNQPPGYPARSGYPPPSGPPNQQQPGTYPSQQDYYRQDQMPQPLSCYPTSQLARQLVAPQSHSKSPYQVYPGQQVPPGAAGQMYPSSPHSKVMPPPAPQPPRRHPDFAKDQPQAAPYPGYPQQRPAMYGWNSSNSSQYRGQYPPQPQGPQPWTGGPARPPNSQPANNQWDRYQQSPYPSSQPQPWGQNIPAPGVVNASPLRPPMPGPRPPYSRPDGKPFTMPATPGMKGQPGVPNSSGYPQSSGPKREIVFPPDSVEATVPVLYKRKRMARSDVAPIEAWRLMMSLRSGLLAESCWALDVLNILLFDDTTIAYFGLTHMPGLLDVLLEHFRRSLGDMFDAPVSPEVEGKWYQVKRKELPDVDLGSVVEPIDPVDRTTLLQTTANFTLLSRKGDPVKIVNRDSDIFVLDNRKVWDIDGDVPDETVAVTEVAPDPWQLTVTDTTTTKYIVMCYQGEFGNVPFVRLLPDSEKEKHSLVKDQSVSDSVPLKESVGEESEIKSVKVNHNPDKNSNSELSNVICKEESVNKDCIVGDRKNCDKKKRTKTLSDVLSRIKKEPVEVNDVLTREIREKVEKNEGLMKKEDENIDKDSDDTKTSKIEMKKENANNELTLSRVNALNENTNSCDADIKEEKGEDDAKSEGTTTHESLKINIRDPAGTLKRRRMSDYEDECYTRDEASLYLVTETQDSLARRCVCLSNILRNLTFVPGNEAEFAKSGTFLSLLGKLLLLHHEHPTRTQKQRNYDREEDADFGDSCSSLQGESEWWWDFLHHIRENILVIAANISGHMDLGQYPEEISRPVLDGLLHWAVCPAAHGQDPFPTVGPSSSLSPQRLALEALCKLCVTDSNVDLVIATPPYSRLERLCAVLTRLLCRSEDQVLREFAVNLLHSLSAADSGMARTIALQSPSVSLLVAFIEQAESLALGVANQHGIGALRDNPDAMGTSLDMLRRAAGTLLHLSRHPDNNPLFLQQEQRLLALVMSQILDQQVASIISRVLYQCSRPTS